MNERTQSNLAAMTRDDWRAVEWAWITDAVIAKGGLRKWARAVGLRNPETLLAYIEEEVTK